MILTIIILIITTITFTASLAINPLTIGVIILLLALILAITFSISISSWVALLIFLIYIGGILVIFSYFVAITPNQNLPIVTIIRIIIISILALRFITYVLEIAPPINYTYTSQTNIIYEKLNIISLIMLALILLFTIVVVVKISTNSKGPLRPFLRYV